MGRLFDAESRLVIFMGRVMDLIILSILWLVCSLPIITIGASTSALYYVTLKMVRNEDSKIAKSFFRAFKLNLKQGILLALLFLVGGAVLYVNYAIISTIEGTIGKALGISLLALTFVFFNTMLYTFALQAQFENRVLTTLKNASLLFIQNLPKTCIILFWNALPFIVLMISANLFFRTLPIWGFLAPAAIAYLCSVQYVKIFDPLMKSAEEATMKEPTET